MKNTGGPAFPNFQFNVGLNQMMEQDGMTLRDYFAAAALSMGEGVWEGKGDDAFAEMAHTCYRIADAMLIERNT